MNIKFDNDPEKEIKLSGDITLTIPGGLRVPKSYPYVETKDLLIQKCLAAWSTFDDQEHPLDFRLVGPPGVGKNATIYALAAIRQQPLYIVQGHEDLTAEDLVISATLDRSGKVKYMASPLLAAMHEGGICFIDEIAKMRPRALAPLASVLDPRRSISSALIGQSFTAKSDFRFCCAYNQSDADAFDLAPWLQRRTLPELEVSQPDFAELEKIVGLHDQTDLVIWGKIENRLRKIRQNTELKLDPGTMLRLIGYIKRLKAFESKHQYNFGDSVEVALRHILGRGLESTKHEK